MFCVPVSFWRDLCLSCDPLILQIFHWKSIPLRSLKIFRKETVREVLHDLIWSMKRLGSMDTRWRTVPFFVSLNFTAELVECISLWRVKVKVYRAIYLTGNPVELHIDHLHVLSSLLLLYVNIDQDYKTWTCQQQNTLEGHTCFVRT